jgi:hypothetical protein
MVERNGLDDATGRGRLIDVRVTGTVDSLERKIGITKEVDK